MTLIPSFKLLLPGRTRVGREENAGKFPPKALASLRNPVREPRIAAQKKKAREQTRAFKGALTGRY